ncbi:hypothetical protein SC657_08580 [Legionella pneumophila]
MEIILVLIFISILWGIVKLSSILASLESIKSELCYGEKKTKLCEANGNLNQIYHAIPNADYTYELKNIYEKLNSIYDELHWTQPLSFAKQMIDSQKEIEDKLFWLPENFKEMIEAQERGVEQLENICKNLEEIVETQLER